MNLLQLLLGQIPEAIYFALFIIFTKELKEKRVLFTILMIIEYILLLNSFPYSTWSHVLYFIISYIIMKILYKDKCNITDVFALGMASIILIPISCISYMITFGNIIFSIIISRILIFSMILLFRNKLQNINKLYYKLWNRNDKVDKKIKSTTFRAINLVLFNISFYVINIGMIATITINNWR